MIVSKNRYIHIKIIFVAVIVEKSIAFSNITGGNKFFKAIELFGLTCQHYRIM